MLLLCEREQRRSSRDVLPWGCQRLQLSLGITLHEAMLAVVADPPALAVIDAALCDAPDRGFVQRLLQMGSHTTVLLLGADGAAWPAHPRLVCTLPTQVGTTVGRWLSARASELETVA